MQPPQKKKKIHQNTNENICLHLNGHNITGSTESANLGLRTITHTHAMNIMGEGTITAGNVISESGAVILNSGKLEEIPAVIYEGVTLKNAEGANAPVVTANGDVTLYGTVEGSMVQRKGTLTIGATGAVDQVTLATTDAKLVIAEGWNGNMVLDATAVMDKNYRIPVENAAVEGELTGTITTTDGFELEIIYGQLGVRMEFDAAEELNYCEHCHEFVAWTPLVASEFMQEDGSDTPVVSTDKHYYVDGAETDVEIGAHSRGVLAQISSGATVCLHLNGHNMISKGNIYAYAGATLNIMGEGTVTYTGA